MKAKSLLSYLGGRCLLSVFFLILTLASVNALAASNPVKGSSTVAPAGFAVVGPFGIFVPGPSPVPPFSGSMVDFEGFAEGTAIVGQYSGLGVTFTQDDLTAPMIDNHPTLFAYGSSSGVGLLTGSAVPAPSPTVAGLVANFTRPVGRVGAYMTDTAPLGTYTVTAFNGVGGVIDTVTVFGTDFPGVSGPPCPLFPAPATGCGVFVGFNTGVSNIASIQFGPSSAFGDAFAIDDLVFAVMGIGEIKPGTPFTPNPSGNGRGLAYDDFNILYYTITATNEIYRVTTAGVSLGAIPNPGRPALCGGLSWDSSTGHLWCGSYDGTSDVYTVNPVTGIATFQFNTNAVVGGMNQDSCYAPGTEVFIDGIALDTDGTLWLSGDAARTVYHIDPAGPVLLGSFLMPDHPFSGATGCSTGIAVAPGGYLELAMQAGADQGTHEIVKVEKLDCW
jgi:hypothetical protein